MNKNLEYYNNNSNIGINQFTFLPQRCSTYGVTRWSLTHNTEKTKNRDLFHFNVSNMRGKIKSEARGMGRAVPSLFRNALFSHIADMTVFLSPPSKLLYQAQMFLINFLWNFVRSFNYIKYVLEVHTVYLHNTLTIAFTSTIPFSRRIDY